jgi:hypothetical protein
MMFLLSVIYIIICIPFAFIGKGRYEGAFLLNWIICIGATPILGAIFNYLGNCYRDDDSDF